ncbi:MAG: hypothetical protein V4505_25720 [Pseudomonadota bacterium]
MSVLAPQFGMRRTAPTAPPRPVLMTYGGRPIQIGSRRHRKILETIAAERIALARLGCTASPQGRALVLEHAHIAWRAANWADAAGLFQAVADSTPSNIHGVSTAEEVGLRRYVHLALCMRCRDFRKGAHDGEMDSLYRGLEA